MFVNTSIFLLQALDDLRNVEAAFADVHRKYERTKQIVEGFKHNEDQLKAYLVRILKNLFFTFNFFDCGQSVNLLRPYLKDNYAGKLKKAEEKFERLKDHAEETLEKANKEIENLTRSQDAEVARLTAILKKTEAKASSLERTVDQVIFIVF